MYSMREVYEYNRFWAIARGAITRWGDVRRLEHAGHRRRRKLQLGVEAGCEFDINTAAPLTLYSTTLRDRRRFHHTLACRAVCHNFARPATSQELLR